MNNNDLIIDENNFGEYFFDIRQNLPKPDQVMAKFTAAADFGAGDTKKDIINLLKGEFGGNAAQQVMRKMVCATEGDSIKVPLEMAKDLAAGMTEEDVLKKPYPFILEMFYYTKEEYVPKNDPHWQIIMFIDTRKKQTVQ